MKPSRSITHCLLALAVGGFFAVGSLHAGQPDWAGKGGKGKAEHMERHDDPRDERQGDRGGERRDYDDHARRDESKGGHAGSRGHFDERRRAAVHDYYDGQFRGGRCPPGLAKKHNGCMPPGQAKKWRVGERLPRDVVYYDVPRPLVVQMGAPPSGYRYVRVASDILMIAIGTGLVVDAIQDLGR